MEFITIDNNNIDNEHICCAFSDKKTAEGYQLKKEWLKERFHEGYVFKRLDAKAKVFIEYAPTESSWVPIEAPNFFMINCFWVSGQYKGKGYGKQLLQMAIDDAKTKGKEGLVTIAGKKKLSFMSDAKWLIKQGFTVVDSSKYNIDLLAYNINKNAVIPRFKTCVASGECLNKDGLTAYYSVRCPYTNYYVTDVLPVIAGKYNIPIKIIKLETTEQAQSAPAPATIFSLFYNGKYITNDLSVCTESKFNKLITTL